MDVNDIDLVRLRKDLDDYFTSSMFITSKFAIKDMVDVQTASPDELIRIAKKNKFDLNKYKNQSASNKKIKKRETKNSDWFNNPLI